MLSPRLNAVMAWGPSSLNVLELSRFGPVAELNGSRVPFAWMRSSWTPLSLFEATMAYVSAPIENTETSCAPPSTVKPPLPLVALPIGTSAGRSAVLIQMLRGASEPGEPGSGSVVLAAVPVARLVMLPPLRDSASVPA